MCGNRSILITTTLNGMGHIQEGQGSQRISMDGLHGWEEIFLGQNILGGISIPRGVQVVSGLAKSALGLQGKTHSIRLKTQNLGIGL